MTAGRGSAEAAPRSFAAPQYKRGQKLAFSFDEDALTLPREAARAALPAGTKVAVAGIEPPAWWWAGTRLVADPSASTRLTLHATSVGPVAAVGPAAGADADEVERQAASLHAKAPQRAEAEWQGHRLARDAPDAEADFPLGAHVTPARHEELLAARMQMPGGLVESWTAVGPGAAPSEFARLQQAVGTYHVVLVGLEDGARTVGLWAGTGPPKTGGKVKPVLRRLFRQQGAWRYGMKSVAA
jgi:hypothetical protein